MRLPRGLDCKTRLARRRVRADAPERRLTARRNLSY